MELVETRLTEEEGSRARDAVVTVAVLYGAFRLAKGVWKHSPVKFARRAHRNPRKMVK